MMWIGYIVGIVGVTVGVINSTLFLLSQKEVKGLIQQLEEMKANSTNQKIRVRGSSKLYRKLATCINNMIHEKNQLRSEYMQMDRELREAIANISHDLRTPLTSIIGYVQLFNREELSEEKKKQYLHIIASRAENLQGLIESFYELSKINSNDYVLEYQEIHLDRIFCELMASFYQDFVDKHLEIQMNIEEHLPSIWADEKAITRILLNLIQNTLRYAKKNIQVNILQVKEEIQLTIINEAGELKMEDVPYLFERFFMANRVRNGEGTGVGLAVVKKLVVMMGGRVEAQLLGEQIAISIILRQPHSKN